MPFLGGALVYDSCEAYALLTAFFKRSDQQIDFEEMLCAYAIISCFCYLNVLGLPFIIFLFT